MTFSSPFKMHIEDETCAIMVDNPRFGHFTQVEDHSVQQSGSVQLKVTDVCRSCRRSPIQRSLIPYIFHNVLPSRSSRERFMNRNTSTVHAIPQSFVSC